MTTYTYEFTAFTEAALLEAGSGNGSNLGYGDSFTMPASADTTFVVTDNDPYLSGDSWNNENANDSSYQTATITIDGEEVGNGGQVYGEQYFWVWGSSGQWYLMIEIEQEGAGDDYFTFYNAYGVPEEGETLTVNSGGNINCWQPNMNNLESPPASVPPVAMLDTITITEGESIGDSSDDAQLNILANDFDTDGTITLTGVSFGETEVDPGDAISVTTERGLTVEVTVDANGNLLFDTGSDFDALKVGESDSFELTYTITDNDGNEATSTVTVTIEGETSVVAADDVITVYESEGAGDLETLDSGADSVLANDTIDGDMYDGLVVTVNGQTGNVGQWIDLEKGRVKLNADGTIDFDAAGDFDALNDDESEAVTLNYTISAVDAGPDEYQCLFFNNLAKGEIVTDQYASAGLTISSANPNNPVMIFDTANPSGGDFDLATSNLGKVLILSEDGNSGNPDDNAGGGTFIFQFDRAADIDSITMLDTEEPAPQIRLYGEDGMLLATIAGPVTSDGGQGVADINMAGVHRMEIELQGSGALDNLIYTIEGPTTVVDQDEGTVTVNVLGESDANANLPPDAVDDAFSTVEATPITGNVLTNDSDPDGDPISVIAVEGGEVGGQIAITTAKGNTGFVTVGSDGAFTFTPDSNFESLVQGETDSFELTYTITDDPSTAAKTNLLFVLDVSNSTVGLDGQNVFDGVGVGDVNGDGRADTVLDAEIQAVISSVNKLLAQGIDPSMVDIGLVTFSGLVDLSRFAAPFNTPTADAETIGGDGTVYQLDSAALIPALQSILSGGWTNYEAGLQEAEGWLAANADSGEANKVIFLSDGRPIIDYVNGAYVSQDNSDYGDEVTRIVNDYDADIAAIGVGANSSLDALNDLDNTGGAEQVLDVETLTLAVEDAVLLPLTDTATITVTINGLSEAPVAVDDVINTDENTAVGAINIITAVDGNVDPTSMLGEDTDPDAPSSELSVTMVTVDGQDIAVAEGGSASFTVTDTLGRTVDVTVDSAGNVTVAAPEGFDTTDATDGVFTFEYQITDADGETATANVTINVDDLVEPVAPDAVDDVINTDENNGVGDINIVTGADGNVDPNSMLGEDTDPDGPTSGLTVTRVIVAGADVAIPAGGSNTFTVTDTLGRSVNVTIDSSGNVTVATPEGFDTSDDTDGSFSFDYEIVDEDGLTDIATVTINVDDLVEPAAPDAVDDVISTDEDTDVSNINIVTGVDGNDAPTSVLGADSDPDGSVDDLTITEVTVGGSVIAVPTTGTTTFTVDNTAGQSADVTIDSQGNVSVTNLTGFDATDDQDAAFSFDYTIVDNDGLTDSATVTINVDDLEEPAAGPEINVVFLLDASDAALSAGSNNSIDAALDLNNDGKGGSHFDASINAVQEAINKMVALLPSNQDVDFGVFSFEGQIGDSTSAVALSDGGQTVFDLTDDVVNIMNDPANYPGDPLDMINDPGEQKFGDNNSAAVDNGVAFYAEAMEAANGFIAANDGSGDADDAINLVFALTATNGMDAENDYLGIANLDFASVEFLNTFAATVGTPPPAFTEDSALTSQLLIAQDLGITVDTLHFGNLEVGSAVEALEAAQLGGTVSDPITLGDGTMDSDLASFLVSVEDNLMA